MQKKEYLLTVKEAAELLSISERAVQKNAMNGKYGEIKQVDGVRGGSRGRIFMIQLAALPEAVQSEYMKRHAVVDEPERLEAAAYDFADAEARQAANERIKAIKEYEAYIAVPGKKTLLTQQFIRVWNDAGRQPRLSQSTLYNWMKLYKQKGMSGLLTEYGKRSGQRSITPEAWKWFADSYLKPSRPSVAYCYSLLVVKAKLEKWTIPAESTIARMVKSDIPEAVRIYRRYGTKKCIDDVLPFIRRDPESIVAGDVFVGDHHVLDLFINVGTIEKAKWVRPWMTAWLDMRSRKFVGWTVNLSPCTDEIIAAFAKAALNPAIGLPKHIYIDNGRDYCSARFAGRGHRGKPLTEEDKSVLESEGKIARSLMDRLNIQTHWAIVENARAKVIERAFKDVVEHFSKAFTMYCGRRPEERPKDLDEKLRHPEKYGMGLDDFRVQFDTWICNVFNKTISQGKGRKGECPDQTYARTRKVVRRADPQVLCLYFMRSTNPFKLGRNGVTFRHEEYYSPEMVLRKGEMVYIRYRDDDPDTIWLYDTKDSYIGEAKRVNSIPAIGASKELLAEEMARQAQGFKVIKEHGLCQSAKKAPDITPLEIAEMYKSFGTAPDVEPPKVVEMVSLPKSGRDAVKAMQATGTDGVNPFAAMSAAKIIKRRDY